MLFSLFTVGFRVVDFHGYSGKAIFQVLFLSEMYARVQCRGNFRCDTSNAKKKNSSFLLIIKDKVCYM